MSMLNLSTEEHAYFVGFVQGDGSLYSNTRNRGKLCIELAERDKDILLRFKNMLDCKSYLHTRTRDTNFKKNYTCSALSIHSLEFRNDLVLNGIPYGKKSETIMPPSNPNLNKIGYIRGLIDSDGSLGLTSTGKPFISFCTKSEPIKEYYLTFIENLVGYKPMVEKNNRDSIYNIMLMGRKAQVVTDALYSNASIGLKRKIDKAAKVSGWVRDPSLRKECSKKFWTPSEDEFIKTHSSKESVDKLKRTRQSVSLRLWRLNKHV